MAGERFFSGSGLSAVDDRGRVELPLFVREVLIGRSDGRSLMLGAHDGDPCLTGFDPAHTATLHAELERRRLTDEAAGLGAEAHHFRARRLFGLAEKILFDSDGVLALPALLRRRGRIADLALFVGTGGAFEIWDPSLAREAGGEDLRVLAEYRLGET